ncbi:MAG TPA: hypothetical protein VGC37_08600 [Friedmanniella sp.]
MPEHYLGVVDLAGRWVARITRYPADSTHPFPEPDIEVDRSPGWRPD